MVLKNYTSIRSFSGNQSGVTPQLTYRISMRWHRLHASGHAPLASFRFEVAGS